MRSGPSMTAAGRVRLDLAYGPKPRNRLDLFAPESSPKGLVVYIHGGFWRTFDKSAWSHLAKGPLAHGYAVAMPSYTLCPEVRMGEIVREVAQAVSHAAGLVDGPILLTGHSAGGHSGDPHGDGRFARCRRPCCRECA